MVRCSVCVCCIYRSPAMLIWQWNFESLILACFAKRTCRSCCACVLRALPNAANSSAKVLCLAELAEHWRILIYAPHPNSFLALLNQALQLSIYDMFVCILVIGFIVIIRVMVMKYSPFTNDVFSFGQNGGPAIFRGKRCRRARARRTREFGQMDRENAKTNIESTKETS